MAIITLDDRLSELETERDAIGKVLKRIKREINRLAEQIETGEVTDKSEAQKILAEARYWLKAVRETETEIEKLKKERAGIAHGYGVDLEAARTEVGCRLHRLAQCQKEKKISG